MDESIKAVASEARQSLDATQKNALNITNPVSAIGYLSGEAQHGRYMQSLADSDMPMWKKQLYMDHERRMFDESVNRNFKRVERMQRAQTQNTNRASNGWIGFAAFASLSIAACTPQGRAFISKAWNGIKSLSA